MAELVDASDSKSGISNDVQVRFLFWAQKVRIRILTFFVLVPHRDKSALCNRRMVEMSWVSKLSASGEQQVILRRFTRNEMIGIE